MLSEMSNDLKKVLLAGIGAVAMTVEKSEDLVKDLVKKGELTMEQGKALNQEQGKALNQELKHTFQKDKGDAQKEPVLKVDQLSAEERAALKRRLEELEANEPQNG